MSPSRATRRHAIHIVGVGDNRIGTVQSMALTVNAFQVPSNRGAETSPSAPDLASIKLIDYYFGLYVSSAERRRLLQKWDEEVSVLPQ